MIFESLINILESQADAEKAAKMEAYMKNLFSFYGIPSPERREIMRDCKAENEFKPEPKSIKDLKALYEYPKRECAYIAMDWMTPWFKKFAVAEDFKNITDLITTNSWWDSVDLIASNILGPFLLKYPELTSKMIEEYNASNDMWLQRSTLIFQLKYRDQTDEKLLFDQCLRYQDSKEFFIQKAMGWGLREYAKVNPKAVYDFVDCHSFPNLTVREACKHRADDGK